jgi:hypothetical protein
LSYCWGGDQEIKTTKDTIHDWEISIPFQRLLRTLQDAVVVASQLNIRFIWIDALCLIQDDAEGMAPEISQMGRIYGSAVVTIAASRAKAVQEGFLHYRDAASSPGLIFELPYRTSNGDLRTVTLLFRSKDSGKHDPLD